MAHVRSRALYDPKAEPATDQRLSDESVRKGAYVRMGRFR